MGWKGREITFPLGMLFRKMYCMGCGTRLKRHRVDNLIKKGDPEYNGRILGGATIGMDRKQVSYYVYKCPNCGLMFTYEKQLEIIGVGYRFAVNGNELTIQAGYSHPVKLDIPTGITVNAISGTEIEVSGADKIVVGEFAANIRKVRQPEPYKGKGIRYKGEHVRRKEGKKAA